MVRGYGSAGFRARLRAQRPRRLGGPPGERRDAGLGLAQPERSPGCPRTVPVRGRPRGARGLAAAEPPAAGFSSRDPGREARVPVRAGLPLMLRAVRAVAVRPRSRAQSLSTSAASRFTSARRCAISWRRPAGASCWGSRVISGPAALAAAGGWVAGVAPLGRLPPAPPATLSDPFPRRRAGRGPRPSARPAPGMGSRRRSPAPAPRRGRWRRDRHRAHRRCRW